MMQKRVLILLGAFIFFLIGMTFYFYYLGSHLPEKIIKEYSGIENYKIESQLHKENEFLLVQLSIDAKDGEHLAEQYKFSHDYNVIKGKLFTDHLPQGPDNWYYLKETKMYGYVCLSLSSDKKHLTILDVFGD